MKLNNRPNVKTAYCVSMKKVPSGFLVKFKSNEGLEMFPKSIFKRKRDLEAEFCGNKY